MLPEQTKTEIPDVSQPRSKRGFAARDTFLKLSPTLLLLLMALLAGGSAWRESATVDEAVYIGAGVSYLQKFDLRLNPEHPPLAKLLASLPLVLKGMHADYSNPSWGISNVPGYADLAQWVFGDLVVNHWNDPSTTLALARLPMLLCTLILGWVVYAYASQLGDRWSGLLCLAVYASTPLFLAFGPLVLNDILVTLFSLITLRSLADVWEAPRRGNVVRLALSLAGALLSKFSSGILFFAALAFVLSTYWRPVADQPGGAADARLWRRLRWRAMAEGVGGAGAVVCICYFVLSWNQLTYAALQGQGLAGRFFARLLMPPLIYWHGLSVFLSTASRPTFILGHSYPSGVWFYFPVLFALKSTVGFLLLLTLTLALAVAPMGPDRPGASGAGVIPPGKSPHWRILWVSLIVFTAVCLASPLDISFRHFSTPVVLSVLLLADLPPLLLRLNSFAPRPARLLTAATILLAASCVLSGVMAYPYYIPYVNAFAGAKPAYTLFNDSNVDWDQSLLEVNRFIAAHGLQDVALDAYGFTDATLTVPRSHFWNCQSPTSLEEGKWVVVSANMILDAHNCGWLTQYPHEVLGGGSMYAFHLADRIPPAGAIGGPPAHGAFREILGLRVDIRGLFLRLSHDSRTLANVGAAPAQ